MKINPLPSLEYLNECFELSSESPSGLIWKVRPKKHFTSHLGWAVFKAKDSGKAPNSIWSRDNISYFVVGILGQRCACHRIVYSIHHNVNLAVDTEIDHHDGDGLNNKISNLRLATRSQNTQNTKVSKNCASQEKGVYWNKHASLWYGTVMHQRKTYHVGYSPSKEVIMQLVRELRESLHKDFCNHG